jgi:phage replication O-like protein O
MANPQKENGYVAIANKIVEAISKQIISPDEWRVLFVILRKTYGWNKKEDWISLSQFCQATNMRKPHVCRAVSKLIKRNIITRIGNAITRIGNEWGSNYQFQKDYEEWKPLPKSVTLPKQVMSVTRSGNESLPKQVPTKDIIKPSITKDKKKRSTPLADDEFWKEVKQIYTWINIDQEIQKMKGYIISPKGKARRWKMTQQRVIEWLNRIDRPVEYKASPEMDYKKFETEGTWLKEATDRGWK